MPHSVSVEQLISCVNVMKSPRRGPQLNISTINDYVKICFNSPAVASVDFRWLVGHHYALQRRHRKAGSNKTIGYEPSLRKVFAGASHVQEHMQRMWARERNESMINGFSSLEIGDVD